MFEKFTRHLSGKENDGAKTGESFKIATPGSSLDCASTGSPRWFPSGKKTNRRSSDGDPVSGYRARGRIVCRRDKR
jgi:hypothetical protein